MKCYFKFAIQVRFILQGESDKLEGDETVLKPLTSSLELFQKLLQIIYRNYGITKSRFTHPGLFAEREVVFGEIFVDHDQ